MYLWKLVHRGEGASVPGDPYVGKASLRHHVLNGTIRSLKEDLESRGDSVDVVIDSYGRTALHYAAISGRLEMLKWLIGEGADINRKDVNQQAPLHMIFPITDYFNASVTGGQYASYGMQWRDMTRVHIALALLQKGADPNTEDHNGSTPLHHAVLQQSFSLVTILLRSGATLTTCDFDGLTPLHLASQLGTLDSVLTCYGDLDAQDVHGDTLLHRIMRPDGVCYYPEILKKVLKKGATVDIENKFHNTPYDLCLLHCQHYKDNRRSGEGVRVRTFNLNALAENKEILVKHIVKLKTADIPVQDDVSAEFHESRKPAAEKLLQLQRDCREELKKLARTKVQGSVALRHIFSRFLTPHYLANHEIVEVIEQILLNVPDLEWNFPIYAHILKQAFEKSKNRYRLLARASQSLLNENRTQALRSLAKNQLVVEHLLEYLSETDLNNLIESV